MDNGSPEFAESKEAIYSGIPESEGPEKRVCATNDREFTGGRWSAQWVGVASNGGSSRPISPTEQAMNNGGVGVISDRPYRGLEDPRILKS